MIFFHVCKGPIELLEKARWFLKDVSGGEEEEEIVNITLIQRPRQIDYIENENPVLIKNVEKGILKD